MADLAKELRNLEQQFGGIRSQSRKP